MERVVVPVTGKTKGQTRPNAKQGDDGILPEKGAEGRRGGRRRYRERYIMRKVERRRLSAQGTLDMHVVKRPKK
jgi:hypothetical protein